MSDCSPDMMREHEHRITATEQRTSEAHERITGIVELIRDFTVEMRVSNKNISDLVGEVRSLTEKISYVAKATDKHEDDISDIKDNMETKDTVLKLYSKIEASEFEYKKGQDAIMAGLRKQQEDLQEHKLEPAREALASQKALQKWLLVGFGSIILTIVSTALVFFIFGK